uniref:Semaphorin 4e n=1 Tax=Lates calcarifer TaxID=8187 RepID=A0A4W6ELQ8_LATCA
ATRCRYPCMTDLVNVHQFHEKGVSNYSTMLLREDLDLLVLGAREAVYALDLKDISKKLASKDECKNKGKDPETECLNYIRILHKMEDDRMYVCGTNAFDPDHMSYYGKLTLQKKQDDGKGKCPFDPFQRYASIMVDNNLYSATSMNFLGSEPVLMRSSPVSIRTEFKSSWLNGKIDKSEEGDDDKVYLFFSETAVECDCYNKLVVSRVARVCKGDLGGQRTLQKKWTSFLKARLDCPVLDSQLPYIIQDTYLWCDPQQHWKECLFYAIFTPQADTSDLSAVCAYRVSDISRVFAEGKYKTPVPVETSFVKWVMYSGDVPVPRPGATLDLPDRTLQFIKDKPLMDQAIQPIDNKPLLVQRGSAFTRIIVNEVQAADGNKYKVMFIGTGTMLKAVNYDGEMFIIEEMQLFQLPEEIKILKSSNVTGQIYAGSDYGAVQIPLASCYRSSSCMDCVLARDPYCDSVLFSDPVKPIDRSIWTGGNMKLSCPAPSNLAKTTWERDNQPLNPSARLQLLQDGLLILNASDSDGGRYRCQSVERSKTEEYTTTVAEYQVSITSDKDRHILFPEAQKDGPSVAGLQAVVALLVVALLILLAWNFYKGHIPLPWNCGKKNSEQSQESHEERGLNSSVTFQEVQRPVPVEDKPLVSGRDSGSNNNHSGRAAEISAAGEETVNLPSLQYIDDDSEI